MPMYEYYCDRCDREVTLTLSIGEHEKGRIQCPRCGGKSLRVAGSTPARRPINDSYLAMSTRHSPGMQSANT